VLAYLWVGIGSALGGMARYWCSGLVAERWGETFPWGTILVNIVGSFVIGLVATLTGPDGRVLVPSDARTFIMAGLCGGFTTFSSFSLQTLNLVRDGDWARAAANVGLSVVLCLAAVTAGHVLAAVINRLGAP
jgi:CrcB protein